MSPPDQPSCTKRSRVAVEDERYGRCVSDLFPNDERLRTASFRLPVAATPSDPFRQGGEPPDAGRQSIARALDELDHLKVNLTFTRLLDTPVG